MSGNPAGVLATRAPGAGQDLVVSHTITQAEVDANGPVINTGTADSNETPVTASTVTTSVTDAPTFSLLNSVTSVTDTNTDSKTDAGDVIHYNLHVSNTGDVT